MLRMVDYESNDDAADSATLAISDSTPATEPAPQAPDPVVYGFSDDLPGAPLRDASGRFAPKVDSAPETAAAEKPVADGSATDDPTAPDAPPAQPAASPTAAVPDTGTPYSFRHRGQTQEFQGAVVRADGAVVIPAAARARLDQMITRGREFETEVPRRLQQMEQRAAAAEAKAQARDAGVEAFSGILENAPDAETFLQRALELYEQMPALKQQRVQDQLAERDRIIAELRGQPVQGTQPPESSGPTDDDVRHGMGNIAIQLRQQDDSLRDFSDDELGNLLGQMENRAKLFLRLSNEDDQAETGMPVGRPVIDNAAFAYELKLLAHPVIQQKQAAAAKARQDAVVAQAAKRNASVTGKPPVPPTPKAGMTATRPGARPEFNSQEDIDNYLAGIGRR